MAFYVGENGSISVAPETTWGTAATTGYEPLFGISSTLSVKKPLIPTAHLTIDPVNSNARAPRFVDGEITCNWSEASGIMDELLKSFFTGGGGSAYTMAGAPATESITAVTAYSDDLAYVYTGLVANSFSIAVNPNEYPVVTMGFIGQDQAKDTTPPGGNTMPGISNLAAPSDVSTVTVGNTALGAKNITINCARSYTGGDRVIIGGVSIHQPAENGPRTIGLSMTVELSDDTGFNSVAKLDSFLSATDADGNLGTIVVGSDNSTFLLSNCRMIGDPPGLGAGMTEFPINVEATAISILPLA